MTNSLLPMGDWSGGREVPVHWGREPMKRWPFFEWWECHSLKEGGGDRSLRYGRAWERRRLFVEGGRCPFIEDGTSLFIEGGRSPFFVEGGRRSFIKRGGHSSRMGGGCLLRMGGGCSSSKGGEGGLHQLDVVGRKNNEFPCWEIQNSTWSHDVGVSTDLEWIVAHKL